MKGNGDVLDVMESHGFGHLDGGRGPPVFLPVPRAVLEVVCPFALSCLAPFCVGQLKAVHGRDEVSQGFSGVNALFTSRPETGPKHRFFAFFEHGAGEAVLPFVQGLLLDGFLRKIEALSCTRYMLLTSLHEGFLQGAKFLVTFILRAVAG